LELLRIIFKKGSLEESFWHKKENLSFLFLTADSRKLLMAARKITLGLKQ